MRSVGLGVRDPRMVFGAPSFAGLDHGTAFEVAPDGRILVRTLPEYPTMAREIVVVQNWFEELKRLTTPK